jgi:hypothetical protein
MLGAIEVGGFQFVGIGEREFEIAADDYAQYGKGRHPASVQHGRLLRLRLRQGDRAKLLFKGDDFTMTNTTPASERGPARRDCRPIRSANSTTKSCRQSPAPLLLSRASDASECRRGMPSHGKLCHEKAFTSPRDAAPQELDFWWNLENAFCGFTA